MSENRNADPGPIFSYHLTPHPCHCGRCNPVAHPSHPLHAELMQVRDRIAHLEAQRDDLQAANTREVERRRKAERERDDEPDTLITPDGDEVCANCGRTHCNCEPPNLEST